MRGMPQYVIERLGAIAGPEAICVCAGRGPAPMWRPQFVATSARTRSPTRLLGTMGYSALPADGAQVAAPDRVVWAIDGDGCFQMTNQELADLRGSTRSRSRSRSSTTPASAWCASAAVALLRPALPNTDLHPSATRAGLRQARRGIASAYAANPRGCGCGDHTKARRSTKTSGWSSTVVERDAMVWPMAAAGVSNDLIQITKDTAPQWDRESPTPRSAVSTPTTTASSGTTAADHAEPRESKTRPSTPRRCSSRTSPACSPASPRSSRGAVSTSTPSRSDRPSTRRSAHHRRRRRRRPCCWSRSQATEQADRSVQGSSNSTASPRCSARSSWPRSAPTHRPAARSSRCPASRGRVVDVTPTRCRSSDWQCRQDPRPARAPGALRRQGAELVQSGIVATAGHPLDHRPRPALGLTPAHASPLDTSGDPAAARRPPRVASVRHTLFVNLGTARNQGVALIGRNVLRRRRRPR